MKKASFYMILSGFSFSLSGFFAEHAIFSGDFFLTLTARFFIPFIFLIPFIVNRVQRKEFWLNSYKQLPRAFSITLSQALFFLCAANSSLFIAMVLYNTGPIFICLFTLFSKTKRATRMEMIASLFGFLGVFLILKTGGIDFKSLFYLGIGVLSGISLAFSQIFLHRSAQTDDNLSIMTYTYLYGSILSAFLSICFTKTSYEEVFMSSPIVLLFLVLMAAGSLGNQWFRGIAYKLTPRISKLSTLLYLNILFSLFLDVLFNDSIPSFIQFTGALFVITSAVVPILMRSDKKQMEQKQVANG
ncbi:DMT family transporter [Bacillus cytotoxicus]|uniref:DMT family transporter n=1 Tax=Bacillus cereus group sp. BfR-BA-01492 TaxID=2920361 RepID=UPI001F5675FF|nr:DMT family transporter [Bacillus cereus group sp. BfR-BA-01492]